MNRMTRFVNGRGSGRFGARTATDLEAAIARIRRRGVHGRRSPAEQAELDVLCRRLACLTPWRVA
jgi:hypothetical protein